MGTYNMECPKCKGDIDCLAGHSAHPANWYCRDQEVCGWTAWKEDREKDKAIEEKTKIVWICNTKDGTQTKSSPVTEDQAENILTTYVDIHYDKIGWIKLPVYDSLGREAIMVFGTYVLRDCHITVEDVK